MPEAPEKNLALDIVRITEAAALSSARWLGRGNKEAGDGAAVDAMRVSFSTLHVDGVVVIGEGEKDHAPMLYNGEKVGIGDGPQLDVAVDPVEGTSLLAYGRPNAISVVGVAPRGSMFNPGPSFYMQKLVVSREARDVVDLDAPVDVNLSRVASAMGKQVKDLASALPDSALMIAIYRGENLIIPHGNTIIFPGDKIMFFASERIHAELDNLFNARGGAR